MVIVLNGQFNGALTFENGTKAEWDKHTLKTQNQAVLKAMDAAHKSLAPSPPIPKSVAQNNKSLWKLIRGDWAQVPPPPAALPTHATPFGTTWCS